MRPVVPAGGRSSRGWPVRIRTGPGDRGVIFRVHHRGYAALADDTGSLGWNVVVDLGPARGGPAPIDLGQRGRHRPPQEAGGGRVTFCGALPTKIVQLQPCDLESKGIVERGNQFVETSFVPCRSFTSVADFNEQLAQWLPTATSRMVRSLRARPIDQVTKDRAAMLAVPPRLAGWLTFTRT